MKNIIFISLLFIASCAYFVPPQVSSKNAAPKSNAIQLSCPSSLTGKSPFIPKDKRESNWLRASVLIGPSAFDRESLSKAPILRDWVPDSDYVFSEAFIFPYEKDSILTCAYQSQVGISLILPLPYNNCTVLNPGPGAKHSTTTGVPHFRCMKKNKSVTSTPPTVEEIIIDMDQSNTGLSISVDFEVSTKQVIVRDEGFLKITIISIPQIRQLDIKGLRPGKTTLTIKDTLGKTRHIYNIKIVSKGRKTFANSYVSFEIPGDWACSLEGSNYICKSEKPELKKYAIIVVSAKVRGEKDFQDTYKAYLEKQINSDGPILEGTVNGHRWVQSVHNSSEVPGYFTHYRATVNEDLGIVISFSVIADLHRDFFPIITSFDSSLQLRPRQPTHNQSYTKLDNYVQLFDLHSSAYSEYFKLK
jgi:hypothetical protein